MKIDSNLIRLRTYSWKQSGTIALWRYAERERNFRGWHMTANREGCASLLSLIDAMISDAVPQTRVVRLTTPTDQDLSVLHPSKRNVIVPAKLRLTMSGSASEWQFPEDSEPAALKIGQDRISALRLGIEDIARGRGDYSIGDGNRHSLQLWFWW
jgi:hypothetical protein